MTGSASVGGHENDIVDDKAVTHNNIFGIKCNYNIILEEPV